jgi:hypothetical protein
VYSRAELSPVPSVARPRLTVSSSTIPEEVYGKWSVGASRKSPPRCSGMVTGVCQNCEQEKATLQCQNCPNSESHFCQRCWEIHIQVKPFKDHQNITIKRLCGNCDINTAVYQCRQCLEPDSLFCKDCSQIHTQIKVFKTHNFLKLDNESLETVMSETSPRPSRFSILLDKLYSKFIYLLKYFDFDEPLSDSFNWIPESLSEIVGTTLDSKTISFGFVIAFFAHFLVKLLFGKNSIYIIIVVGILGVRWLKRSQSTLSDEVKKIEKKNMKVFNEMKALRAKSFVPPQEILSKEEMKSEFWHDPEGDESGDGIASSSLGNDRPILAPKFKPRGVLYQGKKSQQRDRHQDVNKKDL